jgi:UDP-3-O-[3-hydroxymyristoyl] N-acetylglucosamine deacetylase
MTYKRRTLGGEARFGGDGLHTGLPTEVVVRPGDDGIVLACGATRVEALPENVSDTSRCTRLGDVGTVEHLLSALAGLEITDAIIELTAPELPALDGGAAEFFRGLSSAGVEELGEEQAVLPFSRVFVQDGDAKLAISAGTGWWRYCFFTDDRWPGEMVYEAEDVVRDFASEIAPARTFAFEEEVAPLRAAGLGQGLTESSALILGEEGYVNQARFEDEPARHKLLDCIGDLYLAGIPIRFLNVVAERTGHRHNVRAAQLLRESVLAQS